MRGDDEGLRSARRPTPLMCLKKSLAAKLLRYPPLVGGLLAGLAESPAGMEEESRGGAPS